MSDEAQPRRVQAQIAHVVFFDQVGYSLLSLEKQAESMDELRSFILASAPFREADDEDQVIPLDTGDGMALVFLQDPQVAAECALAVSNYSRSHPETPLRIGLNSGPVSLRKDLSGNRNVSGAGIDIGQRVMSVAKPHEVMVSRNMAETLMSFETWRPLLSEAGSFSVKHDQELVLYRLGAEGDPTYPAIVPPLAPKALGRSIAKMIKQDVAPQIATMIKQDVAPQIGKLLTGRKVAVPMLEQFLSQAKPPVSANVTPQWMDFVLAAVVALPIMLLPLHGKAFIPAGLAALAMIQWRRWVRSEQISRQPANVQAEWERWERARRLVSLQNHNMLHNHVPAQVLASLESAARAWHDVRDDLRSMAVTDPLFAKEVQDEVDAIMMSAAAVVAPVLRRDDQGRRHLMQMEADTALMSQMCRRVDRETTRLRDWARDASAVGGTPETSLRERLALSRNERALAEAELGSDIVQG